MDFAKSGAVSSTMSLSLDEFCAFLLDATGSAHAASSLLFRRADYDSKNAVTWDDVLPHILKKHTTQQANERDIPYSISMLRADPDISHQKVSFPPFNVNTVFMFHFKPARDDLDPGPSGLHDCVSAAACLVHPRHGVARGHVLAPAHAKADVILAVQRTSYKVCSRAGPRDCFGGNVKSVRSG
jgi:hypothetical protein